MNNLRARICAMGALLGVKSIIWYAVVASKAYNHPVIPNYPIAKLLYHAQTDAVYALFYYSD